MQLMIWLIYSFSISYQSWQSKPVCFYSRRRAVHFKWLLQGYSKSFNIVCEGLDHIVTSYNIILAHCVDNIMLIGLIVQGMASTLDSLDTYQRVEDTPHKFRCLSHQWSFRGILWFMESRGRSSTEDPALQTTWPGRSKESIVDKNASWSL